MCCFVIHSGIAWIEFLNSDDNLGDILTHLREGDMQGAQFLWLRYEVKKPLRAHATPNASYVNSCCDAKMYLHINSTMVPSNISAISCDVVYCSVL